MFEKLLSSLGIGAMNIETRIEKASFKADETIKGKIFLHGGDADQRISKIKLSLIEQVQNDTDESDFDVMENVLQVYEINSDQVVESKQTVEKPFEFALNHIDFGKGISELTLRTYVYIDSGADAEEDAKIHIE